MCRESVTLHTVERRRAPTDPSLARNGPRGCADWPGDCKSRHTMQLPHLAYGKRRNALFSQRGFTLIELMLVVNTLGLIALITISEFGQFRERAKAGVCIANQHKIHETAILWGMENDPGNAVINVSVIIAAELIQQNAGECPSSNIDDWVDYTLTYVNNEISIMSCNVKGALHAYVP